MCCFSQLWYIRAGSWLAHELTPAPPHCTTTSHYFVQLSHFGDHMSCSIPFRAHKVTQREPRDVLPAAGGVRQLSTPPQLPFALTEG